jgi:hypothetical protein
MLAYVFVPPEAESNVGSNKDTLKPVESTAHAVLLSD